MLRKAPSYKPLSIGLVLFFSLLFCLITILIYWPGLYGPFLLDDMQSIAPTQMERFSWSNLISVSLQNQTGPLGRPLSVFTLALNSLILGHAPFYFKAVNLSLHLLCGLSLGIFVYLIISLMPRDRNIAVPTALLMVFVWLIHPLHVSTVLYVVQRMTQLSTLFILLGLNTYLYGRIRLLTHQKYWLWYILISFIVFFPLAVFSKETGLLFPWYVFCIEYFILKFRCLTEKQRFNLIHFNRIISLTLILGALVYFYYKIQIYFAIFHEKDLTLISRLLTESKVLLFYLSLIFRPILSAMGLYHDDFPISDTLDQSVILSISILIIFIFCIFYCRRQAPIISFGLAWFLVSHSIESTFLPLELVFEHRNYLAMIGVLLIPCYYLNYFLSYRFGKIKLMIIASTIMLILMLGSLTALRSIGWSSTENFLKEANVYHPKSARTHIETSNILLNAKKYDLAIDELNKALELQPNNVGILLHKILIGCQTESVSAQDYKLAESKIKSSTITPYSLMVLNQLVQNMVNQQCSAVSSDRIEQILQSAINNPTLTYRTQYKAILYHLEAGISLFKGNIPLCLALLMKSYEANPQRIEPLIQKAIIEFNHNQFENAQATRALIEQSAHTIRAPADKIQKLDTLLHSRERQ